MKSTLYSSVFLLITTMVLCSCSEFLDIKPDKRLAVPESLQDLRALLDNPQHNTYTSWGDVFSDDYYLSYATWQSISQQGQRNSYVWQNTAEDDIGWTSLYREVYTMNVVLEQLEELDSHSDEWKHIKGTALFLRSYAFYELAQLYTVPYNATTARNELGLPIRISSDIETTFPRSNLADTYDRIVTDLVAAKELLPERTIYPTRPNKAAASGMLSRVFLTLGLYEEAGKYAQQCISSGANELLNYRDIDMMVSTPFILFNKEVVFHTQQAGIAIAPSRAKIDTLLYAEYADTDLRKAAFFMVNDDGSFRFKGNYTGNPNYFFTGISLSEIYLIAAECEARSGRFESAIDWLVSLLINRMTTESLPNLSDNEELLRVILLERRKELVMRNRRWDDLRRLNHDSDTRFQQELSRELDGEKYSLEPNDPNYVLYIPEEVIDLSGIAQNRQ